MSNKSFIADSTFDDSPLSRNSVVQPGAIDNTSKTYRLDIPAVEFCRNMRKRVNPSPPSRLTRLTAPVASPYVRRKRQHSAAIARAAVLHMRRARCHQQTLHAATVARAVRDARMSVSSQRRLAIREQLDRASHNRKLLSESMRDACCANEVTSALSPVSMSKSPPISPSSVVTAAASQGLDAACDIHDKRLAAKMVAAHFLLSRSRRILRHIGLLGSAIRSAPFDSVAARLQTTPALTGARLALRAVDIYTNSEPCAGEVSSRRPLDFRILLSALLVAAHPDIVIDSPLPAITGMTRLTSDDADVIAKARAVAFALHSPSVQTLAYAWKSWRPVFLAWKARDRPLLIDTLIASALATVEKKRAASGMFSALTSVADMHERLTGESRVGESNFIELNNHDEWLSDVRKAVEAIGGPEGIKRLDDALELAERRRGERLIHELLLDPQGLAATLCSATVAPKAVWDRMRQQLSQTPSRLDETSTRLAFVRKMLVALGAKAVKTQWPSIEQSGKLNVSFINAVIDIVAASCKECQAEVFDAGVQRWADDAKEKVRQAGVSNMAENNFLVHAAVDTLMQATDIVSGVYTHVVSWRVQQAANSVATYGVMWERARFSEHIAKGDVNVLRTKDWIRRSCEHVAHSATTDETGKPQNFMWKAVSNGIVNLTLPVTNTNLSGGPQLDEDTVPEILVMDVQRLRRTGYNIRRCAIASALYHTMRVYGSKGISEESVKQWAERVVEASEEENLGNVLEEWMDEHRDVNEPSAQTATKVNVLKGMMRRIVSGNDETYRLMVRRVCKVVISECVRRRTLWTSSLPSSVPSSSSSSRLPETWVSRESLRQLGLPAVVELVDSICSQVFRLVGYTVTVHGERLFQLKNEAEGA